MNNVNWSLHAITNTPSKQLRPAELKFR